jgi:hypothetical protein
MQPFSLFPFRQAWYPGGILRVLYNIRPLNAIEAKKCQDLRGSAPKVPFSVTPSIPNYFGMLTAPYFVLIEFS